MSTQVEQQVPTVSNANLDDKSLANRARGFAAGVASGITKLAVGHPFGTVSPTTPPTHPHQIVNSLINHLPRSTYNYRHHQGANANIRVS
jgi:hypothetical protein